MKQRFATRDVAWAELSSTRKEVIRSNLILLKLFRAIYFAEFVFATLMLFLQHNGVSVTQAGWIFGMMGGVGIFCEVPSGWLADRFGRKWILLIGSALLTAGFLLFTLSYGFVPMLTASGIIGAGYSFISGSDSALAFDTIKHGEWKKEVQEDLYRNFEQTSKAYQAVSGSIGALLGGLAAQVDLRATLWLQLGVYLLLVPVLVCLREQPRSEREERPRPGMMRTVAYALHDHRQLRGYILFFAAVGSLADILLVVQPLYCKDTSVPVWLFGPIVVIWRGIRATGSISAGWYEKLLGPRAAWASVIGVLCAGYLFLAVLPPNGWLLLVLVGPVFVLGVAAPNIQTTMNQYVTSDVRATILSVQSWVSRLVFCITMPTVSWVIDHYSLQGALWFSVIVCGIGGGIALASVNGRVGSD